MIVFAQEVGVTETNLTYNVSDETYTDEWEWQDSSWEFGPKAKFKIEYLNGTEFDSDSDYLDIDEEFVISAYIPESIFRANFNQSLGAVEIHWHLEEFADVISDPSDYTNPSLISDLNLMYYEVHPSEIFDWYYIPPEGIYYEEGWQWEVHSWQENYTFGTGDNWSPESEITYDAESLPSRLKTASENPVSAQEWEEPESFYNLNLSTSIATFNNESKTWTVKWTGKFNERVFLGTYRVDMSLYSNTGERINLWGFSSWDFESNDNPEKWIGVGEVAVYNQWWGFGGSWGIKTFGSSGIETNIVGIDDPLTFRFNISNQIVPEFAFVRMNLPNGYTNITIVEGWHEEKVQHMGGWVFDSATDTYIYDPTTNFTTTEQVYGFYEDKMWVDLWSQNSIMINVSGWDWSGPSPVWVENLWQDWRSKEMFLIYNQTASEFTMKIGVEYWAENPDDPYMGGQRKFIFSDVNASNKVENFFKLDNSNLTTDLSGNTIIEFTGHFTDLLTASENQFWYDAGLIDENGFELWNGGMSNGQIAINKPQANTWIVDSSDGQWDKPYYKMIANESFLIRNRLDGSLEFWNSIDGVSFRLNCWESEWTEEMDMWSELEIIASYNLNNDEISFEAYNRTTKRIWENSTYQDWINVEKEGWHWKYNETLGYDVWVYGIFDSWEWGERTDYHWQEYQFNQDTQEWVKGWLPWKGKETRISTGVDFLLLNGVSKYTTSEGMFLDLNITILDGAPEASYNWEIDFLKNVWGYDYDKPWGEHESLFWIQDNIYYYTVDVDKLFLETPHMDNYIVIDGSSYMIEEIPYVEIDGDIKPIKTTQFLDWNNEIHENLMYYEWDWATGQEYFYYRDALTDEKIIFYEGQKVNIFNITVNGPVLNDTFETFMNRPTQYWDNFASQTVYYFVDILGDLHYISGYTEWNETGGDHIYNYGDPLNYWDAENTHLRTIHNVEQLIIPDEALSWEDRVFFVVLDGYSRLEIASHGIQWANGESYIVDLDGTPYTVIIGDWNEQYGTDKKVIIDEVEHFLSESMDAYKLDYSGSEILVPLNLNGYHHYWSNILKSYFYTIKDDQEFILPYPNANVNDRWEMEATVTGLFDGYTMHYGVIPVLRFVNFDGNLYQMENLTFDGREPISGDVNINGTIYAGEEIYKGLATMINGTPNFDLSIIGESIPYGNSYFNFPFDKEDSIDVLSGQKISSYVWELETLGTSNFYAENGTYFLTLLNGSRLNVEVRYYIPIFNVTVKLYDHQTGHDVVWMKNLLSISGWDYWNHSKKYVPLLNGTFLEIPDQAWIETVEEYQAELKFVPTSTEHNLNLYNETSDSYYSYPINWTEPDFWSEEGQNSMNFTFRSTLYFFDNFSYYNEQAYLENFLQHRYMSNLMVELEPGVWKAIKEPNYDWITLEANGWQKLYNITINSEDFYVLTEEAYIQLSQTIWGQPYGLFQQRQDTLQVKNTWNLIFGTPNENMWDFRVFTTTSEGALDLDGDLSTTHDQYYIYRTYESQDSFSHTREIMEVEIYYDPITSVYGNEMNMFCSMGINYMNWTYEWSEKYTWYKADGTFSVVSQAEMDNITSLILDENDYGRPGYWELERMAKNRTWADVILEAEKYNWNWILDNSHEWTWIEFNIDQNYWADFYADNSSLEIRSAFVTNRFEYAGMMLYMDDNNNGFMDIGSNSEITHYFVPSNVENVTFIEPNVLGADDQFQETREFWGPEGPETRTVDVYSFIGVADLDWGIKFSGVNGTIYPFSNNQMISMWDWYDGVMDGSDFRDFADRPTLVTIDKLEFIVHFDGADTTTALNYNPTIKIDQRVGDWTPHCIGGISNLENYSMSLTYYTLSGRASQGFNDEFNGEPNPETSQEPLDEGGVKVLDENNQTVNNDNQTISESFSMVIDDANSVFAKTEYGSSYDWKFNKSMSLNVAVFTTPISTFSGAFMSGNSKSVCSFGFEAELYFMSVGFPKWDGYEVYNDPTFTAYVGVNAHGEGGLDGFDFLTIIVIVGGITSSVVIAVVVVRIKKKRKEI